LHWVECATNVRTPTARGGQQVIGAFGAQDGAESIQRRDGPVVRASRTAWLARRP